MKNKYFLIIVTFCLLNNVNAQSPDWLWAKGIGGTTPDLSNSIAVDANGNVYTTGSYTGTSDFDPGPGVYNLTSDGDKDVFISKLDASGNFIWAKSFGGLGTDIGHTINIDLAGSGEIYITGEFTGLSDFDPDSAGIYVLNAAGGIDIFISKLDSAGNFIWAGAIGGTSDESISSIAIDLSGNVYAIGSFIGTVDFDPGAGVFDLVSAGSNDIFIAKLDAAGNFISSKSIGGASNDLGFSMVIDPFNGEIYTAGFILSNTDVDPGAGVYNLQGPGIYISKLDSAGNFVWAKAITGLSGAFPYSIVLDPSGSKSIYLNGPFANTVDFDPDSSIIFNLTSNGNYDIFITKLDGSGNFIWVKGIGGVNNDFSNTIAIDPISGSVFITGTFADTIDFDPGTGVFNLIASGSDVFFSSLDSAGNFQWANNVGNGSFLTGKSMAINSSGHLLVTGAYMGLSVVFGTHTLINASSSTADIFIAKLDSTFITRNKELSNYERVLVFPNPFTNNVTVNIPNQKSTDISVRIKNTLGQTIVSNEYSSHQNQININLEFLTHGIYFLEIYFAEARIVRKILKQ